MSFRKQKMDFSGDKSRMVMATREGQAAMRRLRTYTRKPRRSSRNSLYTPLGRSFPATMYMKFTYNKSFTLVSSLGAVNYMQFRLNSIFDPDYSTGIGQLKATPWNEMNNIY